MGGRKLLILEEFSYSFLVASVIFAFLAVVLILGAIVGSVVAGSGIIQQAKTLLINILPTVLAEAIDGRYGHVISLAAQLFLTFVVFALVGLSGLVVCRAGRKLSQRQSCRQ